MNSPIRLRAPSPALVVAVAALFVALGGAAYAVSLDKNDVKSRHIARGAVKGSDLHRNAVKRNKIKGGAVTAAKIADGAVDTAALANRAVVRQKIKAQAVTKQKIANGAVEADKIADGAVVTAKLADGAVTAAKLGAGSVTGATMKAVVDVSVDSPMDGCAEATDSVTGAEPDDHVVVTAEPGSPDSLVATGEAGEGEITVRACGIGGDPDATDFNVLVID
jgi:hypothetical protein